MQREFPRGTIVSWSGSIDTIPITWRLCDGIRLTPDLREYFVVGAGGAYSPGVIGGTDEHNHDFEGNAHDHRHDIDGTISSGTDIRRWLDWQVAVGTTDNENGNPPYYRLAYIMYDGRLR